MRLRRDILHYWTIAQALLLFFATPQALGEYGTAGVPEASIFKPVTPEAAPALPPGKASLRPAVAKASKPSSSSSGLLAALRKAPRQPAFHPPGNGPDTFTLPPDPGPIATTPATNNVAKDPLAALRSREQLEEQLQKVRKMLADTEAPLSDVTSVQTIPAGAGASAPEPALKPVAVDVQPAQISRLLTTVQSSDRQRFQMEQRIAVVKDNLSKKDTYTSRLSNASGGTALQASLEFNTLVRGSTPTFRQNGASGILARRLALEREVQDADSLVRSRSLAQRGERGTSVLAFGAEPVSRSAAEDDISDALLTRHRPNYVDSAVKDEPAKPASSVSNPQSDMHRLTYTSAAVSAFDGSPQAR